MILVGGLSGSGKTTMVRRFVSQHSEYSHFEASAILRSIGRPISDLSKNQALENQIELANWLRVHASSNKETAILDGHGILILGGMPIKVPIDFFRAIEISRIILVTGDPSEIQRNRPWPATLNNQDAIRRLQKLESDALSETASELGVAIHNVSSGNDQRFDEAIRQP